MYELILLFLGVLHVIVSQTCWRSPDTYWSWVGVVTEMLVIGVAVAGIVNNVPFIDHSSSGLGVSPEVVGKW